jgi:predicted MPP superfamily phosphohydrolase
MPMRNLDPAFEGMRIVQISDLHYSPVVWRRYLIQYIRWVNDLNPDLVVVTGDLITGGYRFAERVATILSHVKAPHGVVCTFGNHDYSIYGRNSSEEGNRRADYLEECLEGHNLIVLRNEAHAVHRNGSSRPLVLVGLDDEWSGHIDPPRGFSGVDPNLPIICLNHNPANCTQLLDYPWQWMLSGHTHGRQVGTGALGRRFYAHRYRHFTHGYYAVHGRHLYVNRGLSYGLRMHHWCRPEVTVFKLTSETVST